MIDGAIRFGASDYRGAVEAMLPVRHDAIRVGGSHAQRDIVELTLIAAAERSKQRDLARALLAERVSGGRPRARSRLTKGRGPTRRGEPRRAQVVKLYKI